MNKSFISKPHKSAPDSTPLLKRALKSESFKRRWASSAIKIPLYHGSLCNLDDLSLESWHPGNDFGSGIYLTNSPKDANANYANPNSSELIAKIERKVSELCALGRASDCDEAAIRADLFDHEGALHPVFAFLENPIVLDGAGSTEIDWGYDEDEPRTLYQLADAFRVIEEDGLAKNIDHVRIMDELALEFPDGGKAHRIIECLRNSEGLYNASCRKLEEMNWKSSHEVEIIRLAIESAGFDGLIDHSVHSKFRGFMKGIDNKTCHIIAFREDQVCSVFSKEWKAKPEPTPEKEVILTCSL